MPRSRRVWRSLSQKLFCHGREPREVSCASPIYVSSSGSALLSSPEQAAPPDIQHGSMSPRNGGSESAAVALDRPKELLNAPALSSGPDQPQRDPSDWGLTILEAVPFSVAVLSSDAKEVLHHCHGSEPGAAQFLTQALQMSSMSNTTSQQAGNVRTTFLDALLGDLEEHALMIVQGERSCWKGSVSVEVASGERPSSTHHSRDKQPDGNNKMDKAFSSPAELHQGALLAGQAATSLAGPAGQAKSALSADSTGATAAAAAAPPAAADAMLGSRDESLHFETNFLLLDPTYKLPLDAWAGPGFGSVDPNQPRSSFMDSAWMAKKSVRSSSFQACPSSYVDENSSVAASPGYDEPFRLRKPPPRPCKSMSASCPRSLAARRNSLLMSENSIEKLIGDDEFKVKSLLRSFAKQARSSDGSKAHSSKKELFCSSKTEVGSVLACKASSSASSNLAEPWTKDMGKDSVQRFDVQLSLLRPADRERSPLLVVISDSSDHSRAQATLSALAENQLELLSCLLPQHAIQFLCLQSTAALTQHVGQQAHAHEGVTLLFMDIVGFTSMSKAVEPVEVMVLLNTLFSQFDHLTNLHGVHKVETAGDCYIVSGGIMSTKLSSDGFQVVAEHQMDPADSAKHVMSFAKAILEVAKQVKMPDTNKPVCIRVGLHTGNVVSGLIGSKLPKFSIFGDTMNTASRMESTGVPGRIHASATTRWLLSDEQWEPRDGLVEVKGKGPMETFLWIPEPTTTPCQPLRLISPPPSTGLLPCLLLEQTQSLLKHINAHKSSSAAQWQGECLSLALGGECEPIKRMNSWRNSFL